MDQLWNVLIHIHIFNSQRIFGRIDEAVLFNSIIPTTWLEAFAPVTTHSEYHRAEVAIRTVNGAHIAMNKVFQLHSRLCLQITRRCQIHLSRGNYPGDP
ncbi:hypothetical protein D1872_275210 [compost metagenome]